jgi:BirA family biotin operon repressor/biotin-[acetyl-CoA-carboxylase] ligase
LPSQREPRIFYRKEVDSTQDEAFRLLDSGEVPPFFVVSDIQTSGRGRYHRPWVSGRGGAWLTLLLEQDRKKFHNAWVYGFAASLSVVELLSEFKIRASISWPNDVLVNGSKISGVLAEARLNGNEKAIEETESGHPLAVGVGLNVTNDVSRVAAPYPVTNMLDNLKSSIDFESVRKRLIEILFIRAFNGEQDLTIKEYRTKLQTLGRVVTVKSGNWMISGKAVDLDSDGALIIRTDKGLEKVFTGEIVRKRTQG